MKKYLEAMVGLVAVIGRMSVLTGVTSVVIGATLSITTAATAIAQSSPWTAEEMLLPISPVGETSCLRDADEISTDDMELGVNGKRAQPPAPMDPALHALVERARTQAKQVLMRAWRRTKNEQRAAMYSTLYKTLEGAPIAAPERGQEHPGCARPILAYAYVPQNGRKIDPTIYICGWVVQDAFYSQPKALGQTMIHESAHLSGVSDECDTTQIEIDAMRDSGEGIAFRNGYIDDCRTRMGEAATAFLFSDAESREDST